MRPFHERHRNLATIMISAGERKGKITGFKYTLMTLCATALTTQQSAQHCRQNKKAF